MPNLFFLTEIPASVPHSPLEGSKSASRPLTCEQLSVAFSSRMITVDVSPDKCVAELKPISSSHRRFLIVLKLCLSQVSTL